MKEKIVEILKSKIHVGSKYLGGDEESIFVFNNSNNLDESDMDWFVGQIADEILSSNQ